MQQQLQVSTCRNCRISKTIPRIAHNSMG